jgi:ribosomal-protein-alanine N-acetyltransferase
MSALGKTLNERSEATVRAMGPSDVPAILSILKESAGASIWSEQSLRESALSGPAWVAEQKGCAIGFLIGRAAADEFEVLNLAVAQAYRRRGIATRLLKTMATWLQTAGTRHAYLEVRASNDAAIALYERHGFGPCGRRVRYYQYPQEDALMLSWDREGGL